MATMRPLFIAVRRSTTTRRVLHCVAACAVNIVMAERRTQGSCSLDSCR